MLGKPSASFNSRLVALSLNQLYLISQVFESFYSNICMSKRMSSGVISFDWSERLGMSERFKGSTNGDSDLTVANNSGCFRFCCRSDDIANSFAFCMNWSYSWWTW